jgi:hypothetical protein
VRRKNKEELEELKLKPRWAAVEELKRGNLATVRVSRYVWKVEVKAAEVAEEVS